nr:unnamed protein product [Callosobruchus chinensis]
MENKRKRYQCESSKQEVDEVEKENRPEKKRSEIKFFKYSENDLLRAVHSIKSGEISLNYASKLYGIPKSTLSNKMNKKVPMERKMGPTTVLSKEEEKELVIWILNKAKLGFLLSGEDVKDSIQNVLKQCLRPNPFKDDRPEKKWLALFLSRHPDVVKRNAEACAEGDDKNLFLFWKNCFSQTDAIKHPEKIPPSSADNTKESTFNNTLGIETSNADQFLSFGLESLGLDPSEFLPDNMSINCEDKNAAIDTDLTLNANMIPALEGTSLESNCESVSRSWTPSKKASTSKLGLDPSEIFPHNVTLICVDKNAAIDTDLSLNSNRIPALEGTSLKSNCESVSRS